VLVMAHVGVIVARAMVLAIFGGIFVYGSIGSTPKSTGSVVDCMCAAYISLFAFEESMF
jgi:hypothetical protein